MIRVTGKLLSPEERKFLRRAAHWCLDKFIPKSQKDSVTVSIHVKELTDDLKDFAAIMVWTRSPTGRKIFRVEISQNGINLRSTKTIYKFKAILRLMFHELVHVKQYLNNEIFDYSNGDVRYKGKIYTCVQSVGNESVDDEKYYDQPWEIEAYGRQEGLLSLFKNMILDEEEG